MTQILTAFRAFFRILGDGRFSDRVRILLAGGTPAGERPASVAPARSEALTLLAALQREARLVDFLQEPINAYSDAQVGAAVRDIHDKAATMLADYFDIKPLLGTPEGGRCEVPAGFDPVQYKLTGNLSAQAPVTGTVRHPGWVATRCKLPEWTGRAESALAIAPAEVEVR